MQSSAAAAPGHGQLLAGVAPTPAAAQPADGFRFGVTFGGISTFGLVAEAMDRHGSTEIHLGTIALRDLSLSVVRKHYLGAASARPTVGFGIWTLVGFSRAEGERTGVAVLLRAPIGVEWRMADRHALTLDIAINRSGQVAQHAVDFRPDGGLGQTGTDIRSHLRGGDGMIEMANAGVWQPYIWHVLFPPQSTGSA